MSTAKPSSVAWRHRMRECVKSNCNGVCLIDVAETAVAAVCGVLSAVRCSREPLRLVSL